MFHTALLQDVTHSPLSDTHHHVLSHSLPGIGRFEPHIIAHIFTIQWGLPSPKKAFKFDFESEEGFTFCVSPPFNTLSTEKLKEIVAEAKTTFKWQSSKEGQLRKGDSFKDWMFSRPLALRSIFWEISSDAYTYFKMEHETELNTEIFGVRRFQILD